MRCLLLFLMLTSPLLAEAPTGSASQALAQIALEGWSEQGARLYLSSLLADNRLDEKELQQLKSLSAAKEPVHLEGRSIPVAEGRARELLILVSDPPNMHTLWTGTPEQFRHLVDLSTLTPTLQQRVTAFTRSKFQPLWEQSNLLNSYAPLVYEIGRCHKLLKASAEPTTEKGVFLLCNALHSLEAPETSETPQRGFLYMWMLHPYLEKESGKAVQGNEE